MKRYSVLWLKISLATLILLGSAPMSSDAAARNLDTGKEDYWKSDLEYYEPSGSYFQLVRDDTKRLSGVRWHEAAADAAKMTYKGRRGRLAIVDNGALYGWILEKFELVSRSTEKTWIGLRYMCGSRALMWANGKEHPHSAFSFWDYPWYRVDGIRCGKSKVPWMGVYISGETSRWRAAGDKKIYSRYLVEYPAE
jgi:hypothetical protein